MPRESRRRAFTVSVTMPKGVTESDMRAYIKVAVQSWCGQYEPPHEDCDGEYDEGDPLFQLNPNTVHVSKAFR